MKSLPSRIWRSKDYAEKHDKVSRHEGMYKRYKTEVTTYGREWGK